MPRDNIDGGFLRRDRFILSGANGVVKVTSLLPVGAMNQLNSGKSGSVEGYFTVNAAINNRTPVEMERLLGLPPGYLAGGAFVQPLLRIPQPSEYTYELTADHPDGLAFNAAYSDPAYPPGSPAVHQFRINDGVSIPVDMGKCVRVMPGQRYAAR